MGVEMTDLEGIATGFSTAYAAGPEEGTRFWTDLYGDQVLVSHAHETSPTDGLIAGEDLRLLHRAEMKAWMKASDFRAEVTTRILARGVGVEVVMTGKLPGGDPLRTRVWNRLTFDDDGRIVGMDNVHLEKCEKAFELGLFDEMIELANRLRAGAPQHT
jgi:hypothetical protein